MAAALLVTVVTIVAARNVPALLEIILLQRLPLDRGVRFAIATVTRYAIAGVGVVVAFGTIGIGWSKVQWLIAAMTVGLGFGLQEIFANFISGLILLLERPIRVGDTVTVGDTTGTVTRIRIRATTILDWDRRELVVPNREFITGRLVNWTLSDTVHRMIFPVGVAYGSNTRLVEQALLRVARAEPLVLGDPEPSVLFRGFGDSSLEFELRVFIPDMDDYATIWHRLNMAIDDAFREARIDIAFPQRDLHIRSVRASFPIDAGGSMEGDATQDAPG
jgi:potassium efflux system protein